MKLITFELGEKTIVVVRKHWFVLLVDFFFALLVYALPLAAYWFILALPELAEGIAVPSFALPGNVFFFLVVLWTFLLWIRLFSVWTDYYLDSWTVTTKRIIDIEQEGFFRRKVGSFRIDKIQDITVSMEGLIPTLLNFGTIHVETAGSHSEEFIIRNIPNPRGLKDMMHRELDRVLEPGETKAF